MTPSTAFILGGVFGAVIMLIGFIVWNLQSPDGLDESEDSVRKFTDEWNEAKAKVKARLKRD